MRERHIHDTMHCGAGMTWSSLTPQNTLPAEMSDTTCETGISNQYKHSNLAFRAQEYQNSYSQRHPRSTTFPHCPLDPILCNRMLPPDAADAEAESFLGASPPPPAADHPMPLAESLCRISLFFLFFSR